MKILKNEIGQRIRNLRENKGLSQMKLAEKLQPYLSLVLEGDTGKQVISQLENGKRGLTIEIAIAYSKIFGVSLDYLFLQSDDWQPEYKEASNLGLSNEAIKTLDWLNTIIEKEAYYPHIDALRALNFILKDRKHMNILWLIANYLFYNFKETMDGRKDIELKINGADEGVAFEVEYLNDLPLTLISSQLKNWKVMISDGLGGGITWRQ